MSTASAVFSPVRTLRTLVLAMAILAGGLGAVFTAPAQEAAAAGPCGVWSMVRSNPAWPPGYYYVQAWATTSCDYALPQAMAVQLWVIRSDGSYTLHSRSDFGTETNTMTGQTKAVIAACGITYRTQVLHLVYGSYSVHWSAPLKRC